MATHATNEVDHLRGIVRAKGLDYLGDDCRAGNDLRGFASEHEGVGVVFHSVPTCLTRTMLFTTFYWFSTILLLFTGFFVRRIVILLGTKVP